MAKEFDIYLRRRLKECDLMVYSLPFRDGLTATNRIILESCVEACVMYKFIAVQTGSELVSKIDKILKTCYELLNEHMILGAAAEFQTHYSIYPESSAIEIYNTPNIPLLGNMFMGAESVIEIGASPLLVSIGKSLGTGSSALELSVNLQDALKQSLLRVGSNIVLDTEITQTNTRKFLEMSVPVMPNAELTNLCYLLTTAADTAMEIAAYVLGTEIRFSFGRGFSGIAFGSKVSKEWAQKFEVIRNTLDILADVSVTLMQIIEPESTAVEFAAAASSIVKRHRLLVEMDTDMISDYDDMTLEDIDYVILT